MFQYTICRQVCVPQLAEKRSRSDPLLKFWRKKTAAVYVPATVCLYFLYIFCFLRLPHPKRIDQNDQADDQKYISRHDHTRCLGQTCHKGPAAHQNNTNQSCNFIFSHTFHSRTLLLYTDVVSNFFGCSSGTILFFDYRCMCYFHQYKVDDTAEDQTCQGR